MGIRERIHRQVRQRFGAAEDNMDPWILIYNPASGSFREDTLARLREDLRARGVDAEPRPTRAPGHATELAREVRGASRIAVYGGDGTLSEVANGLGPESPPLVFLPGGTANVMAHELEIPQDPRQAAALMVDAPPVEIWPGTVNGRRFLLMAGFGFDGAAVQAVSGRLKRLVGKGAYFWAGFQILAANNPGVRLELPDGTVADAKWAVAARAGRYGGKHIIHSGAGLTRPALGILGVPGPWILPFLAGSLGLGLNVGKRAIHRSEQTSIRVTADQPIHVQLDGEYFGSGQSFDVGLSPVPLRLCMPLKGL